MPWEHSADGLIKHLVHDKLNTREMCVEAYMQFLKARREVGHPPAHVGGDHLRRRRLRLRPALGSEVGLPRSIRVGMGAGAQGLRLEARRLHLHSAVHQHQHVAGDNDECRLIVMSNRITKEMGFDWFDQVENAQASMRRRTAGRGTLFRQLAHHADQIGLALEADAGNVRHHDVAGLDPNAVGKFRHTAEQVRVRCRQARAPRRC